MRLAMLSVLMLAVSGCSAPHGVSANDKREATAIDRPSARMPGMDRPATGTPATGQPATDRRDAASHPATPARAATLALDGEGLRIVMVATGASRPVPFGTGKADALGMLERVRGAPPAQGENIDCGASNAVWPDGLTVWFARDRFVGWSLASSSSPLSTVGGLAMGSTRAEVENGATVARIVPSSLGEEFTAGDVAGLLASADADARVTHLWAGATCIAR